MFDSAFPGSGQAVNWQGFSSPPTIPFVVAGGISPETIADVVRATAPDVIDASSALEVPPRSGVKDVGRVQVFLDTLAAHLAAEDAADSIKKEDRDVYV